MSTLALGLLSLLLLLPALPGAASAMAGAECLDGAAAYERKPTLAGLQTLMPCLDHRDPRVRAVLFDKLLHREVWEEPGFKDVRPRLMEVARKGQRDRSIDVSAKADGMVWWLENSKQFDEERARAAADAAKEARAAAKAAAAPRRLTLSFIFGAGVAAQTLIFVLASGADPRGLALAAVCGLIGLLPGKHEHEYELHFHVAYCFVVYAFVAFAMYKKEIMARVSETSLLVNSLTLLYLCAAFLEGPRRGLLLGLAALPTLGTLAVAFLIRDWSFKTKLACYVWFLVLAAANTCFQVRFGNLGFLFSAETSPDPVDLFFTGMAFTVLAASLFYIYILIPLADKHETQEHRMKRWREDAHAMAGRFSDYQLTPGQALQITALQLGFYAANHWLRLMMPARVMNVSMVLLPLGFGLLYGPRRAAAPAAPVAAAGRRRLSEPSGT